MQNQVIPIKRGANPNETWEALSSPRGMCFTIILEMPVPEIKN